MASGWLVVRCSSTVRKLAESWSSHLDRSRARSNERSCGTSIGATRPFPASRSVIAAVVFAMPAEFAPWR